MTALLHFPTPNGLSLNLSSLASPNFATSYSLNGIGILDGSISYLYTSLPLQIAHRSKDIPLRRIIPSYRQLQELQRPEAALQGRFWQSGEAVGTRDTLLYGRLFLPNSHLEALYLRRLSPITQLKISCVSSSQLGSGGSILFLLSQDRAKYSTEYLYSADSALLGVRGLYNFGPDPREFNSQSTSEYESRLEGPSRYGRFSAGAELYYGILNKSGGMSTGFRFATLPQHDGFPYTMTLTVNPLMGNLTSTYAVRAGKFLTLCSKFDFNVYSYESGFQVGMELWRKKQKSDELAWVVRKLHEPGKSGWGEPLLDDLRPETIVPQESPHASLNPGIEESLAGFENESTAGVLKARLNQDGDIGVLWEGKFKELLYSFGVHIDFKQRERIFRGVGLEIQYSS